MLLNFICFLLATVLSIAGTVVILENTKLPDWLIPFAVVIMLAINIVILEFGGYDF